MQMTGQPAEADRMMTTPALQIRHLCKSLSGRPILQDVSFSVYPGEIFGFLGPNGSGKTTTIKVALGLLNIDRGDVLIDGVDIRSNFEEAIAKVGGIIENPEMYRYLSGLENLRVYARMYGKTVTKERIDEVVRQVRLEGRIGDKISRYSLGMRQRLGVAQAILHRPKLLILDEPTNGLDPAGIKELRDILKYLAKEENIAVFVSSHMLAELELMCDRFGIIDRGRIIDIRTINELKEIRVNAASVYEIAIKPEAAEAAVGALTSASIDAALDEGKLIVTLTEEALPQAVRTLVLADVDVYTVTKRERSLEEAYMELTDNQKIGGVGV